MHLITMGINHKSAPLSVREKLAVTEDRMQTVIAELMTSCLISEVVLISTCNRTELYLSAKSSVPVLRWLRKQENLELIELKQYTYILQDEYAVRHLMRVASGLDSMVLGEAEILGQLKSSYNIAAGSGGLGKLLHKVFQSSFAISKKVRNNTEIGSSSVSVAYIAVRLANKIFTDLSLKQVLVIGAGYTSNLILRHLLTAKIKTIFIANRTVARARQLIQNLPSFNRKECKVYFVKLEQIPDILPNMDIVISSTASPLPILGKGMVERAIKERKHKSMYMVDLAVPRDIEPEVSKLSDVYLYAIDDLTAMANENQKTREGAIDHAEIIINGAVKEVMGWLQARNLVKTLLKFRDNCEKIKDLELNKAKQQLAQGKDPDEVLQSMAQNMLNKFMHAPTKCIRVASYDNDIKLLAAAEKLFNI